MGMTLELAEGLPLPLAAVTSRIGFTGQSESGKSYAATKLAESMLDAQAQIIGMDPVGIWYGLKFGKDQRSPGLPVVVFGGVNQDLPLLPDSGKVLAEVLARSGASAVLDVSEFTMGELARFTAAFAEHFFDAKKRHKGPVHIFWEEAQSFAPQELPPDPHAALMLNRVVRMVKVGRNYGIGNSLITQEPQAVSKRALSQVNCLFIGYMQGEAARKAVKNWISDRARSQADLDLVAELPKLKTGEMFAAEPKWFAGIRRVHILEKRTFDSSKTPHLGEVAPKPGKLADVDLTELRAALSQEVAKAEADDPVALRRRIGELEKQLGGNLPGRYSPQAEAQLQAEVSRLKAELDRRPTPEAFAAATRALRIHHDNRRRVLEFLGEVRKFSAVAVDALEDQVIEKLELEVAPVPRRPLHKEDYPGPGSGRVTPPPRANGHDPDGEIPPAAERMLTALAIRHPTPLTRRQLATLSKYGSPGGGGFRNTLSVLSSNGLVEKQGKTVALSAAGVAWFHGAMPESQSPEEIRAMWRAELPPKAQEMFDLILERAPRGITRADLAAATGYEAVDGGGFRNTLSVLSSNGLIVKAGDEVRAVEELIG